MSKDTAFSWLWGTTFLNLVLGAVIWLFNTVALETDNFDYSSDAANAVLWQAIGSSLWGFGVLVFIVTLATSAIVGAIEGKPLSGDQTARPKRTLDEKMEASSNARSKSLKQWLDEDKK